MAFWTRTIVVLLLAGMMAQISCVQVYRALFAMNRKAIAERLCEKRTRDCCGKCFLQKKVASAHDDREVPAEKTTPLKPVADSQEMMPGMEPIAHGLVALIESITLLPSTGGMALAEGHGRPIDHPPDSLLYMNAA
ncbi:MAG: hypothetical protein HGB02_08810 [Chlorobiaceae bacterium]|nr:hypothetical protein [Chlorobiaceae bacterium]